MRASEVGDSSPVFVDSVALIALANRSDQYHALAKLILAELGLAHAPLLTSDWVLAETLASCATLRLRRSGVSIVESFTRSPNGTVIPATRRGWTEAFQLYKKRPDKEWSLIDCTSILACRKHKLRRVLTGDSHFTQAGFCALLV